MKARSITALVLSLAASGAMAATLNVSITGPGGHSNGKYGNTNALHAAANAVLEIGKAVPGAVASDLNAGASVNAIAADASFKVAVRDEDVPLVKEAVKKGCDAENAFRGVKEGDLTDGAPAWVRFEMK